MLSIYDDQGFSIKMRNAIKEMQGGVIKVEQETTRKKQAGRLRRTPNRGRDRTRHEPDGGAHAGGAPSTAGRERAGRDGTRGRAGETREPAQAPHPGEGNPKEVRSGGKKSVWTR